MTVLPIVPSQPLASRRSSRGFGEQLRQGPGQFILVRAVEFKDVVEISFVGPDDCAIPVGAPDQDRGFGKCIAQDVELRVLSGLAEAVNENALTLARQIGYRQAVLGRQSSRREG